MSVSGGERRASADPRRRARLRADLGAGLLIALLAMFVAGSVVWFVAAATSEGTFDAADAFVGLGYMAAVVAVVLLAVVAVRSVRAWRPGAGWRRGAPRATGGDYEIIRNQLRWGVMLILGGAAFGFVTLVVTGVDDATAGTVLALSTGVIGAGATLLPAGAATGAGTRISESASSEPGSGAPIAITGPALPGGDGSVVLYGIAWPRGNDVKASFEYREAAGEGRPSAEPSLTAGQPLDGSRESIPVTEVLSGLEPEAQFSYRLIVIDASGARQAGEERRFTAS